MKQATLLDLDQPMVSLRDVVSLSQSEAADVRGITRQTQNKAEAHGDHVFLTTLREAADSFGLEIVISVRKKAT